MLAALKSGTDIRGTAVGENPGLSDEAVKKILVAFVGFLSEKTGLPPENMTVCIGHDSRISANRIKNAAVAAMTSLGVRVLDCALSSTPAMFMTTLQDGVTAGVQITASHHPYDKNGLKFFTREGGFGGGDISEILKRADLSPLPDCENARPAEKYDFMSRYCEILRQLIIDGVNSEKRNLPLEGFHIVTDAGNGAGGFFATEVLEKLGADISGSQFLEPDGMFPNHIPNPENETAMDFISRAVIKSKADLGVIFDTDVDRAACVGCDGKEINRNRLVALASFIALENSPGGTVVTDSVTSDGLKDFIENQLHGVHHRFRRGYKNVIDEAIRLNNEGINCPLAIETSGHAALRENYFLDDGAYLMTKIIILAARLRREGKTVEELISSLQEPYEAKELRFKILLDDFKPYGENVVKQLEKYCARFPFATPAPDNAEGFRVSFDADHGNGWLLLRLSVHDPLLPLNIESSEKGGVQKITDFFYDFIKDYDKLDLSPIKSASSV